MPEIEVIVPKDCPGCGAPFQPGMGIVLVISKNGERRVYHPDCAPPSHAIQSP